MKNRSTVHIGLDVHKESIAVAFAAPGDEPQWLGDFGSRQCDIYRFIRTLQSKGKTLVAVPGPASLPGFAPCDPDPTRAQDKFSRQ